MSLLLLIELDLLSVITFLIYSPVSDIYNFFASVVFAFNSAFFG